jgi:hypothetical protein
MASFVYMVVVNISYNERDDPLSDNLYVVDFSRDKSRFHAML